MIPAPLASGPALPRRGAWFEQVVTRQGWPQTRSMSLAMQSEIAPPQEVL